MGLALGRANAENAGRTLELAPDYLTFGPVSRYAPPHAHDSPVPSLARVLTQTVTNARCY